MDNKYKKWEALEKECAAEEQAELAAKKAERDRRKAERQQGRGVKGGSGDPIRDAYEQAFENKKGEMKITREEEQKFKKAFKDPKFRELMNDYMEEISDPKHRKEQEAYLHQLEADNKVPEDKEFMKPKPGFVVKTQKVEDKSKMFVNIVHAEKVDQPTMQRCEKGVNWQLPYTLGPLRQEKDKKGELIPAIDCCYHPQTLARASKDPRFKKLIVNTALDAVERAFKDVQKQEVKIDRNYHVLKGVQYKNGEPVTMMLSTQKKKEAFPKATAELAAKEKAAKDEAAAKQTLEDAPRPEDESYAAATADDLADEPSARRPAATATDTQKPRQPNKKTKKKPAVKAGFLDKGKKSKKPSKVQHVGPETPEYRMVERGQLDLSQFLTSDLAAHGQHKRPEELVAHITLPKLKSASGIELDVSERRLVVSDERNLYHLNVALPFPVQEDKGSAKFDKGKRRLTITMPVQIPTKQEREEWRLAAQRAKEELQSKAIIQETDADATLSSEMEGDVDVDQEQRLTVPYSPDEIEEHKHSLKERERQMMKKDVTDIEEKEHNQWVQRGKDLTLMRKTTKAEREKKKTHEHWVPAEEEQRDEVAEAVRRAQLELKAFREREAKTKAEAAAAAEVQQETEARIKLEAMRKAALKIELRKSKTQYDDAPRPLYTFKQNAKNVTLLVQVPAVAQDTVHFEVTEDLVELCFAACAEDGKRNGYRFAFRPAGTIDASRCRHQVATKNMVVILAKANPGEQWPQLEAAAEKEPDAVEPEYVFKQNDSGAMLMVQVSGILRDTVAAAFQPNSVEISFTAENEDQQTRYALSLKPFGAIVPEKSRYDVATRNMVVVLWKECQGTKWDSLQAKAAFLACEAFDGAKQGYVFKLGPTGLGYYVDDEKEPAQQFTKLPAAAAPGRNSPPPEPTPEPVATPSAQFKPAVGKAEQQGSIDAGNCSFVNTMMYELD